MESIIENECNSGEKKGCSPWDSGRPILAPTQHSSEVPWMSREFDGRPSSKSEDCCKQNTQWAQKRWSKRWPIVLKKRHRKMMPESMKKCYFHEFEQSTSGWPFRWSNRSVQPIYPMGYCSLSYIPHMWPFLSTSMAAWKFSAHQIANCKRIFQLHTHLLAYTPENLCGQSRI